MKYLITALIALGLLGNAYLDPSPQAGWHLEAPRKAVQAGSKTNKGVRSHTLEKPSQGCRNETWFSTSVCPQRTENLGTYNAAAKSNQTHYEKYVSSHPDQQSFFSPKLIKGSSGSLGASNGVASWYHEGARTATGERYNPDGITCAHRTLPFGTRLVVTNLNNGRSVTCKVNDRGPFIKGRIVDLSRGSAKVLGIINSGTAHVAISVE